MALSDYDRDFDNADTSSQVTPGNQFPDGTYKLKIKRVRLNPTDKGDLLAFDAEVVFPQQYAGKKADVTFWFPDEATQQKKEIAAKSLKFFTQACGINVKPSDFTRENIRNTFEGFVLQAKKETRKHQGNEYIGWKYWERVQAPKFSAADGSDLDDDPGDTNLPESKDIDEEIDLDEDPFTKNGW